MSIEYQVLGAPGRDNAVFARVNTGKAIHRLLFDCGDDCITDLANAEVQSVDHLLFSHLHMDHIGGFDGFFRRTYNRPAPPCLVWGPPRTIAIMHCRLRGFMWNLFEGDTGTWYVHDIHPDRVERARFVTGEAYEHAHDAGTRPFAGTLIDEPAFTISALHMDHHTPCMAYIVRESPHLNVDTARLAEMGLPAGPWLRRLKEPAPDEDPAVEVAGARHDLAALRAALLVETPGESLAYLTDFLLDEAAQERLSEALRGCTTIVCESQYREADVELALRHHHMTASQAAVLARRAGAGRLILFHLSDRYRPPEWLELLAEARAIFPSTYFPEHWGLDLAS